MIELDVSLAALERTTFGYSPLTEVLTSVRLLAANPRVVGREWARTCRAEVPPQDLALLQSVVPGPESHYSPRFLHAHTRDQTTDIDDWLPYLSSFDPEAAFQDVEASWHPRPVPKPASVLRTPDGMERLSQAVGRYWRTAIAPYWPGINRVARQEVEARSLRIAKEGMLSVFDELHPALARTGGRLRITKHYASWTKPVSELALVPSVFVWPHIGVIPSAGNRFTLVYPARAFASAIERSVADRPGSLSALLGPTRAALLTLCGSPLTGSWAARSLDMSPSTVSRHLNILSEAGLLRSERVGREVVFRQTHLGSAVADAACSYPLSIHPHGT